MTNSTNEPTEEQNDERPARIGGWTGLLLLLGAATAAAQTFSPSFAPGVYERVAEQPAIDSKRITALVWSYGGGAVLVALDRYADEQRGFSRAIVYYPDCRSVRPWKPATPVLMLLGREDDVAPGKPCQASAKKSAAPEAVRIVWYPGAYHAFDVSELTAKTRGPWGTMRLRNPRSIERARSARLGSP